MAVGQHPEVQQFGDMPMAVAVLVEDVNAMLVIPS
jgi:hypothetical protein